MLWMLGLLAGAHGAPLQFSSLQVDADLEGVHVAYELDDASWEDVERAREAGHNITLAFDLHADDYTYTAVVGVNAPSRILTLSRRQWPTGMSTLVHLKRHTANIDSLASPGHAGKTLTLTIHGGVEGASPLIAPTRPDELPPVEPMEEQVAAPEIVARAGRSDRPTYLPTEPQREPAVYEQRAPTPSASAKQACEAAFQRQDLVEACEVIADARDAGAQEVKACARIPLMARRIECVAQLRRRDERPAYSALNACIDTFGADSDAMRCFAVTARYKDDPANDVTICSQGFDSAREVISCIKRLDRVEWDATGVVRACAQSFNGDDRMDCLVLGTKYGDRSGLVLACSEVFTKAGHQMDCVHLLGSRKGDVVGTVAACNDLFEKDGHKMECIERARRHTDPGVLQGCSTIQHTGDRLDCTGG